MENVVGIGEYVTSNNVTDTIKTFALASCVAVTVYCPKKKAGGMIHVALPSPMGQNCDNRLGYFATTGIPLLINKVCTEFGCLKAELIIQIFGGANSINKNDVFHVGKRNIEAVTDTLSMLNLEINMSDVSDKYSRTIEMSMETGDIKVSRQLLII